jgi:hypothetical protein
MLKKLLKDSGKVWLGFDARNELWKKIDEGKTVGPVLYARIKSKGSSTLIIAEYTLNRLHQLVEKVIDPTFEAFMQDLTIQRAETQK